MALTRVSADAAGPGLPRQRQPLPKEGRPHVPRRPGRGMRRPYPHQVRQPNGGDVSPEEVRPEPERWSLVCLSSRMLSTMLQTVCQSLSDNNQVVRSAALFALGQFSEHLQVRNFFIFVVTIGSFDFHISIPSLQNIQATAKVKFYAEK